MFKTLAAALCVVVSNAYTWNTPKILDSFIDPVTFESWAGSDAFAKYGVILGDVNLGMMTAMQPDPSSMTTTCYEKAKTTTDLMAKLLDLTDMTSSIMDKFNVLQVKTIEQLEACELTKMQFLFDGFLSKLPELAGMGSNMLTQAIAGIPAINGSTDGADTTTVWIVYRNIVPQFEK